MCRCACFPAHNFVIHIFVLIFFTGDNERTAAKKDFFFCFQRGKTVSEERQRVLIQEKLAERKKRWEREQEQQQAEQSQMVAEQEKAIKQVLNSQAGLAEEYVKHSDYEDQRLRCYKPMREHE